jgi:hypothetical protein
VARTTNDRNLYQVLVVKTEGLAKLAKPKLICDNRRHVVKEGGITCSGFF